MASKRRIEKKIADIHYVVSGHDLSSAQAKSLEEDLLIDSSDRVARLSLIGYYQWLTEDSICADRYLAHLTWMSVNRPESDCCYYFHLGKNFSPKQISDFFQLWEGQVQLHPNNDKVIGNAASILFSKNVDLSGRLFGRAQSLNPDEFLWTRQIAQHYLYLAMKGPQADRRLNAALAIDQMNNYLGLIAQTRGLDEERGEYINMLELMPKMAMDFGYLKEARAWTAKLLNIGKNRTLRLYAQIAFIHLACIDLKEGDLRKCRRHLRRLLLDFKEHTSTHLVVNPQLINLLKELLSLNERELVIQSLEVCAQKCDSDKREQLLLWHKQVQSGLTPDFDLPTT